MGKMKNWLSMLVATGMVVSMAGCGKKAKADNSVNDGYQPQITSVQQGQTIALLDGDIYTFASNYNKKLYAKDFANGDFKVNRFAPKPATLSWENTRDGALYYTVKVGLKKDLSDAEKYLVSGTSLDVENLFAAKKYYYQIYAHYENDEVVKSRIFHFTTADLPRTVHIEGVSNTRDLGGRLTVDGTHRVKQGMIYRGGEVDSAWGHITEEGKRVMVQELGIKTDLDLRNGLNYKNSPIDDSLNYINVSAPYYTSSTTGIMASEYKDALITEVRTFANPDNYPIYLHCSLGRDRAGTLAFMISALLGVGEMDLYRDYEMSFFSVNGWADANQGNGKIEELIVQLDYLYNFFKSYDKGSLAENTATFMIRYLGITQSEIDTIREIMLEEV